MRRNHAQTAHATVLVFVVSTVAVAEDKPQYEADGITVPAARASEPLRDSLSVELALSYLEAGAAAWSKARKCVSCHTNGTYLSARASLTPHFGAPAQEMRDFFVAELRELEATPRDKQLSGVTPTQVAYIAWGLSSWDAHVTEQLSKETKDALDLAFAVQAEDGSWGNVDCWPPFESDTYHGAIVMALAMHEAPGWRQQKLKPPVQQGVDKLLHYLKSTPPPHDYARVWLLRAAARFPGLLERDAKKATIETLKTHQRADGGWSIRSFAAPEAWGNGRRAEKIRGEASVGDPPSDAHQTGLVILALLEGGVPASDPDLVRGLEWLRANQRQSGRWWTRSLNTEKQHYITYSATAYALSALAKSGALEPKKKAAAASPAPAKGD